VKLASADCKRCIVSKVAPDTNAKDWKRRSKFKRDGDTVRVFENSMTGDAAEVVETDGFMDVKLMESNVEEIAEAMKGSRPEYLYAVIDSQEEPGMLEISFTTLEEWERYKRQSDSMIDGVARVMNAMDIYEDMENFYLVELVKIEEVLSTLKKDWRFSQSDEFKKSLEECGV